MSLSLLSRSQTVERTFSATCTSNFNNSLLCCLKNTSRQRDKLRPTRCSRPPAQRVAYMMTLTRKLLLETQNGSPKQATSSRTKILVGEPAPSCRAASNSASTEQNSSQNESSCLFRDFVWEGKLSRRLVKQLPLEQCTAVQARIMNAILQGGDLVVEANEGYERTLAFLIPTIQRYLIEPNVRHGRVSILIIVPTQGLAVSLEKAVNKIIGRYPWSCQPAIGGSKFHIDVQRFRQRCDILVTTPSRLSYLLKENDFAERMGQLRCVILDEAGKLNEWNHRKYLREIAEFLLPQGSERQILVFSDQSIESLSDLTTTFLKGGYQHLRLIQEHSPSHRDFDQKYLVIDSEWHLPMLAKLIWDASRASPVSKMIGFFSTARGVALAAAMLSKLDLGMPIFEIHSRKSSASRNRVAQEFAESRSGILLSSDLTIYGGFEFPGVTSVIQVGLPASVSKYLHRLDHARSEGLRLLIVAPWEQQFLAEKGLRNIPLSEEYADDNIVKLLGGWKEEVDHAMSSVDEKTKARAYQAMLSYYAARRDVMGLSLESVVFVANLYAKRTLRWKLGIEGKEGLPPVSLKAAALMKMPASLKQRALNIQPRPGEWMSNVAGR